ncbi:hypothetical protein [Candidatus Protochlamydia amoebophila]|uniref:Uncharacterized protein n=1 Tax=Protochlamydia amoebophila (strain UWE25) TaxID=264201 RepID=Q6MD51_PARUW|nr:hypothetical protein [Candidatus Protochlamydia amoebophila]CAF23498.1 unnamed protein product [Candidatus Protochlamydia amoebophila UWE25]
MDPINIFRSWTTTHRNDFPSHTIVTDAIMAVATSVISLAFADAYQRQSPQFSAILRIVPVIAVAVWVIRRLDFNAVYLSPTFSTELNTFDQPHYQSNHFGRVWNWCSTPYYWAAKRMYLLPFIPFPVISSVPRNRQYDYENNYDVPTYSSHFPVIRNNEMHLLPSRRFSEVNHTPATPSPSFRESSYSSMPFPNVAQPFKTSSVSTSASFSRNTFGNMQELPQTR